MRKFSASENLLLIFSFETKKQIFSLRRFFCRLQKLLRHFRDFVEKSLKTKVNSLVEREIPKMFACDELKWMKSQQICFKFDQFGPISRPKGANKNVGDFFISPKRKINLIHAISWPRFGTEF